MLIDRDWMARKKHLPLLKKLSSVIDDQCSELSNNNFAVDFYNSLETEDKVNLTDTDCFFLMQTINGYLKNYNKSLKLITFCLENAPNEIFNALALQTRSLLELSGILFVISNKDLKGQLDIARARRLRSLAEKIQSSTTSERDLRDTYDKQLNLIVLTAPEFEKYRDPTTLTTTQFLNYYKKYSEHVKEIKPGKNSILKGRLTNRDKNYYTDMYGHLSNFVHGDPISNTGAEDQPVWFSTMCIPLTCLTAELIDNDIFGGKNKQKIRECLTDYDKDSDLLKNLEPLK